MLNLIFWVIFGFLTGWVGTILSSTTSTQALSIALAGIFGGTLGGTLVQITSGQQVISSYNPQSIVGATVTAILVVFLATIFGNQQTSR